MGIDEENEEGNMSKRNVLITTEHRGVFFGEVEGATLGVQNIRLENARMCVYWIAELGGVLGLASRGPVSGCRVGPEVPSIELAGVTSVTDCTTEAAAAWREAKWSM